MLIALNYYYYYQNKWRQPKSEKQNVYKIAEQPHKHPRHWKKRKQTLRKQTKINNSLKTTQRTRVKHRGREIIPHANMCRQKTSSKLGRPTPRDLKLTITRMSHSRSTSMFYPLTSWRQLTIFGLLWILYNIHIPATQRRWLRGLRIWSGQSQETAWIWRSRSRRWLLAADLQTGEQYSRIGRMKA